MKKPVAESDKFIVHDVEYYYACPKCGAEYPTAGECRAHIHKCRTVVA